MVVDSQQHCCASTSTLYSHAHICTSSFQVFYPAHTCFSKTIHIQQKPPLFTRHMIQRLFLQSHTIPLPYSHPLKHIINNRKGKTVQETVLKPNSFKIVQALDPGLKITFILPLMLARQKLKKVSEVSSGYNCPWFVMCNICALSLWD